MRKFLIRNSLKMKTRLFSVNKNVMEIIGFYFFAAGKVRRGQTMPENDALVQVVKMHPEILQQMLSTVLNIIMFEDCRNQWSMSRPLLGLILLNEDYFQSLRDQVNKSLNL